ncbi:hypothetical protein FRC03_002989 [Tulasnella sp. 419]|nr:hypothetical protein FRC03_002989 [Tulasnella sp. 419]
MPQRRRCVSSPPYVSRNCLKHAKEGKETPSWLTFPTSPISLSRWLLSFSFVIMTLYGGDLQVPPTVSVGSLMVNKPILKVLVVVNRRSPCTKGWHFLKVITGGQTSHKVLLYSSESHLLRQASYVVATIYNSDTNMCVTTTNCHIW